MMGKSKGMAADWKQLWKRNAVVAAIALFVCAAVYLNWNYEQELESGKVLGQSTMVDGTADPLIQETAPLSTDELSAESQNQYFANARLNRQQARDSALSILQDAAQGKDVDQAMKDQTLSSIQTMADYTVTEAQIENLVVAKGYQDCVAFIGEDSLSLAVASSGNGLSQTDTARIVDVVGQVSDFEASQIKIIEVEGS